MSVELLAMPRTGRRPGPSTTRAALLEVARRRFAEGGYDGTSLRAIAADAGVDPAVAVHFFGSKDALFRAAVGWPFDPAAVAARLAQVDADELGPTMARLFLELWDDPATGAALSAVLRSAMTHEASAALLRAFVGQQLFGRLGHVVGGPDAAMRIELAAGQMIGVAVLRYVLRVDPIASAPTEELVGWLGAALSRYLGPPVGHGRDPVVPKGANVQARRRADQAPEA
jgi:AcrR family transcriptional regulator